MPNAQLRVRKRMVHRAPSRLRDSDRRTMPGAALGKPRDGRKGRRGRWPCVAEKSGTLHNGGRMYETPKLERLGTLRELTLAGGANTPGDGANPYHRY